MKPTAKAAPKTAPSREDLRAKAAAAKESAASALARAKGPHKDIFEPILDVANTAEEFSEIAAEKIKTAYAASLDQQRKKVADAIDTEFWFAVYFRSREEKYAFLNAAKLILDGDKYFDGNRFAEVLGIRFPKGEAVFTVKKPDPVLAELSER